MNNTQEAIDTFCCALHADDQAAVRALLERHPEIKALMNEALGPFDSPVILLVRSTGMLDVLLEAGADVNAKSRWWAGGFGLLHQAPPALATYAIERGALVDVHSAARLGLLGQLQVLVAADPQLVHSRGGDGQTPLHFAANVEVARFLLDSGAAIDARDVDHESTPAQYMVADRQEVARFLVARGCQTDLLMAAALGDVDLARRLLDEDPASIRLMVSEEHFPKRNQRAGGTIYQWTLGFYATAHQVARRFGHEGVLRLLLDRTPPPVRLIDACWAEDAGMVEALRAQFPAARFDFTEQDCRQPAHAARNNKADVVRLLLECGLPVDARGQHQGTPLHWAAFHGNAGMARTILRHGPLLETRDADFNETPVGWAIHGSLHGWYRDSGDYVGTVEALLNAGAQPPKSIGGSVAVQSLLRDRAGSSS
jgi:ankyrin repeat protein